MQGPTVITTPGATVEGRTLRGPVEIRASDVTLRSCRIKTPAGGDGVRFTDGADNVTIANCLITGPRRTMPPPRAWLRRLAWRARFEWGRTRIRMTRKRP